MHIVTDSGFCYQLQPDDQVMADRGFKIHDLLSFYQCSLAIPPLKHANLQMLTSDVQKTSLIANVRIYVEEAIKRVKDFTINNNNNMTLFNEGNIIYWLPSSLQYGPP